MTINCLSLFKKIHFHQNKVLILGYFLLPWPSPPVCYNYSGKKKYVKTKRHHITIKAPRFLYFHHMWCFGLLPFIRLQRMQSEPILEQKLEVDKLGCNVGRVTHCVIWGFNHVLPPFEGASWYADIFSPVCIHELHECSFPPVLTADSHPNS